MVAAMAGSASIVRFRTLREGDRQDAAERSQAPRSVSRCNHMELYLDTINPSLRPMR
jgi:hypothetical protein